MPEGMGYLAGLYWELKRTSDPLTWQEMDAWTRMMDRQIEPEEARVLMKMDGIHCRVMNEG
jgi:phage portal protein BeeE